MCVDVHTLHDMRSYELINLLNIELRTWLEFIRCRTDFVYIFTTVTQGVAVSVAVTVACGRAKTKAEATYTTLSISSSQA